MAPDGTDYFAVGPDRWTRQIAEGIDAADVLFLRLGGDGIAAHADGGAGHGRDVDDPAVIASVLRALRAATSSTATLMERMTTLEIHLRPGSASAAAMAAAARQGGGGGPVLLHFNPFSRRSNLGRAFARALADAGLLDRELPPEDDAGGGDAGAGAP